MAVSGKTGQRHHVSGWTDLCYLSGGRALYRKQPAYNDGYRQKGIGGALIIGVALKFAIKDRPGI